MRPLTATELLQIWENGFDQTNLEKALHLLTVACTIPDLHTIAKWSIEQRDARLFKLREWMFGSRFNNTAQCPSCKEKVEWEMNMSDLHLPTFLAKDIVKTYQLETKDYNIEFRLPNSEDIAQSDPNEILANCLLQVKKGEKNLALNNIPKAVLETLSEEMEKVSHFSNISMKLSCPACNTQWETLFDVVSYLWAEIDHWAKRILQEVYILASAFGWSERDILNMSARRRHYYLGMLSL